MTELSIIAMFLGFIYAIRRLTSPVLIKREIRK